MIVPLRLLGGDGDGEEGFAVVSRKQRHRAWATFLNLARLARH